MPKIFDLLKDPEFQSLGVEDKRGVLSHFDKDFEKLDQSNQDNVMRHFNLIRPELTKEEQNPVATAASSIYTPALVTVGGIGGAVAGAGAAPLAGPLAPAAPVAGSALGMAAGEAAAGGIDRILGIKSPISTPSEVVSEIGSDLSKGAAYEAGGQLISKAAGAIAAPLEGKMTDASKWVLNKAKELGIDLTPAEVVRSKSLSLLESLMDNIPIAGDIADKFKLRQMKQMVRERDRLLSEYGSPDKIETLGEKIQQMADDLIREHAKTNTQNSIALKDRLLRKLGSQQTYEEAGLSAQEARKVASEKRFSEANRLYEDVANAIDPNATHVPENYRKMALEMLNQQKLPSKALQDPDVLSLLSDVSGKNQIDSLLGKVPPELHDVVLKQLSKEQIGGMTWAQMAADRSRLGKLIADSDPAYGFSPGARGMKLVSSEAAGVYKQLFKALDEDMGKVVESYGPEAKNALDLARSYYGESKQMFGAPFMLRIAKADPERVIDMLFKPGATTPIRMMRKSIGNEEFTNLSNSFTNRLLEAPEGAVLDSGILRARIKKYGIDTIEEIYGPRASDIVDLPNQLDAVSPELKNNQFFKTLLKKEPAKVVDYLVQPNNIKNAEKLVEGLGEGAKTQVGKGLVTKILQDMAENSHGDFSPSMMDSAMNKYGDDVLQKWLPKDVFKDLKDFSKVAMRLPKSAAMGNNPSGTGRMVLAGAAGIYLINNPKRALKIAVPAAIIANLYFSPTGRKYLLEGINTSLRSPEAQKVFSRLSSSAMELMNKEFEEQ